MKLITWNVNGLRAALKKDILNWIRGQAPDVLCLQEIKAKPEQIEAAHMQQLELIFPRITWNPAVRPGYSGVATLVRVQPAETRIGMGTPTFDEEGRVIISLYPNFILFNLYVPHGRHDHSRVPFKLDFYDRLLEISNEFHRQGKRIILCGDINTAHKDIDLRNPRENINTSGFLPEERAWLDKFLAHGFVDVFRHLYPDRVQYTWWTYRANARKRNIGWRLDYFLVSESLIEQVQDVIINDDVPGSDHCPVTLLLEK